VDYRTTDIENVKKLGRRELSHYNTEKRYIRKNGAVIWGSVTVSVIRSGTGEFVSYLAVVEDITKKRAMEETLRENEEKFREIFDNINDSIQINEIDENGIPGKFIEINAVAASMLGYTREELFRKGPLDFATGYLSLPLDQIFYDLKTRGYSIFETEHIRKDGTKFPVEVNVRVVFLRNKRVALAVIRDNSERKRDESALKEAHKKLRILSGITRHDINNQLSVLRAYLDVIREKHHDPSLDGFFNKTAAAAEQISLMIHFAGDYEKIGMHSPLWQDCRAVLENVIKDGPQEQVNVINDIPAGTEVFADPLIARVFYNLMDNAARHGGKITWIRFSTEDRDGDRIIVCADDGVGIPADEKEKIFEKNFGKNTGFGLFISREILSITGISIRETGEQGKGARFEIVVPGKIFRKKCE
jgi:PAS domain S-box-containing protein